MRIFAPEKTKNKHNNLITMESNDSPLSETELKSNPIDDWFKDAFATATYIAPKAPEPEEPKVSEFEECESIPLSRIKEGFIRWAKSMDTKNDIKSLMTSLTAILDTKSWSDNQNEVLYAALEEYETARQDCMPKEAVQHKHVDREYNIYGRLDNYY